MIHDAHIHVGQFFEKYTSPQKLITLTKRLGIDKYAVSSTTICESNFIKVLNEIEYLTTHDTERAVPVLWITPSMLSDDIVLNNFIDSGLEWKCIKIHPDLHPRLWTEDNGYFDYLLDIAQYLDLPIMIHTGGKGYSRCGIWEYRISTNPNQIFILAHCRPCQEAINIISRNSNAYGDLAFVPQEDIKNLLCSGIASRLLWGSDLPIVENYISDGNEVYYNNMLAYLNRTASVLQYSDITNNNFFKFRKY